MKKKSLLIVILTILIFMSTGFFKRDNLEVINIVTTAIIANEIVYL